MAAKKKRRGYGSKLFVSEDAGATYRQIGDCRTIKPAKRSRGEIDISYTDQDTEVDDAMPGRIKDDKIELEVFLDEDTLEDLQEIFEVASEEYDTATPPYRWKIQYPLLAGQANPARLQRYGFVTDLEEMEHANEDEALKYKVSIRCVGARSFTPGS